MLAAAKPDAQLRHDVRPPAVRGRDGARGARRAAGGRPAPAAVNAFSIATSAISVPLSTSATCAACSFSLMLVRIEAACAQRTPMPPPEVASMLDHAEVRVRKAKKRREV